LRKQRKTEEIRERERERERERKETVGSEITDKVNE
jgi:hypothetical protein